MCVLTDSRKMHFTIRYFAEITTLISGANSDEIVATRVVVKLSPYNFSVYIMGCGNGVIVGRCGCGCTTLQPYVFVHLFHIFILQSYKYLHKYKRAAPKFLIFRRIRRLPLMLFGRLQKNAYFRHTNFQTALYERQDHESRSRQYPHSVGSNGRKSQIGSSRRRHGWRRLRQCALFELHHQRS